MVNDGVGAAVVSLHLVGRAPLAHPAEQLFEAMLDGWRAQQLSRGLSFSTIDARERAVRRFHVHSNEWPWLWTRGHVEEWSTDLRLHRAGQPQHLARAAGVGADVLLVRHGPGLWLGW